MGRKTRERELYNNVSFTRFTLPLPLSWQISGLASVSPWLVMCSDVRYAGMILQRAWI
jgi:hypothetical protein